MPLFTPEELEELRRADAEIDDEFHETMDEIRESRSRDREAKIDRMDNREKKIAAQKAAYYAANREKIAAQKAAYYAANREKYNAYMREYRRNHKKSATGSTSSGSGDQKNT